MCIVLWGLFYYLIIIERVKDGVDRTNNTDSQQCQGNAHKFMCKCTYIYMQIHIYICMCIIIMICINRKEARTIWTAELQLASSLACLLAGN